MTVSSLTLLLFLARIWGSWERVSTLGTAPSGACIYIYSLFINKDNCSLYILLFLLHFYCNTLSALYTEKRRPGAVPQAQAPEPFVIPAITGVGKRNKVQCLHGRTYRLHNSFFASSS
jgi:hypothetical protein